MKTILLTLLFTRIVCFGQADIWWSAAASVPKAAAGGGGFTPSGYMEWWTPASVSGSDGRVTNSWVGTNSIAATYPVADNGGTLSNAVVNGLDTLNWNANAGSSRDLRAGLPANAATYAVYWAAKLKDIPAGDPYAFFGTTNGSLYGYCAVIAGGTYRMYSGSFLSSATGAAYPSTNWTVYCFTNGAGSAALFTNGVLCVAGSVGTDTMQGFNIAACNNGGFAPYAGAMGDIFFFTNVPYSSHPDELEEYLLDRYGL